MDSFTAQAALARLGLLLVTATLGCGDSNRTQSAPTASSCVAYQTPAGFSGATPAVALRRDVVPIFAEHCAASSCHGSTRGGNNGVYLGGDDAARVASETTSQASVALPTMQLVKAGDPQNSFLMRKLDGDLCVLHKSCEGGDCLDTMPKGKPLLSETQRDVVRRWIAQGAKDD